MGEVVSFAAAEVSRRHRQRRRLDRRRAAAAGWGRVMENKKFRKSSCNSFTKQ